MASSHYFDDLHKVIDPRTEFRAGAFRATARDLYCDGWKIESQTKDFGRVLMIGLRNPHHDIVGICELVIGGGGYLQHHIIPPYLYIRPDAVIDARLSRRIEMPRFEFSPMLLGEALCDPRLGGAIPMKEIEMMIYSAENNQDKEPDELIVMPEDIPGLLQKIRQAQEPRAREILANERKRDSMSQLQMKAKILTFGKTA